MRPLIVLPTYDEADNIVEVLERVRKACSAAEVLVVDDNSPDGTAERAEAWAESQGGVTVLRRPGKSGLGSAYRAGFRWGLDRGFDVLVEMDSDLQHDPAVVPELIAQVAEGAHLAIGSRYVPGGAMPGWKRSRKLISSLANRYASLILDLPVADATAGFRAYSAEALAGLDLNSIRADGYGFQVEMAYSVHRRGGQIAEVPITFGNRRRGSSKMSAVIVVEAAILVTWWALRDRVVAPLVALVTRR